MVHTNYVVVDGVNLKPTHRTAGLHPWTGAMELWSCEAEIGFALIVASDVKIASVSHCLVTINQWDFSRDIFMVLLMVNSG